MLTSAFTTECGHIGPSGFANFDFLRLGLPLSSSPCLPCPAILGRFKTLCFGGMAGAGWGGGLHVAP